MKLLQTITVCIDGLCWDVFPAPWWPSASRSEAQIPVTGNNGHYADLFSDASVLQGINLATQQISDKDTREALRNGIVAAAKAMEKRGAPQNVKISLRE